MKAKIFLFFIIILCAFGAGVFLKEDVLKVYNQTATQINNSFDFEKININSVVSEIGKKVSAPEPLKVFGSKGVETLSAEKVILQTNLQRQNNGLSVLKENTELNAAALAKANDMFKNQYFEHNSPGGVDPGQLAKSNGYDYILVGENLILGTSFASEKDMVESWMDSPGHRANILNNRYTEIGVAVVKGTYKGDTVWIGVQEFGLPLSSCPQPSSTAKSQIETNQAQLEALASQIKQTSEVNQYNALAGQYNKLAKETKSLADSYNVQVNKFNACVAGQ